MNANWLLRFHLQLPHDVQMKPETDKIRLLQSGLFSDVTVKCGERTWNLHKNILCSRNIWFEKALTGNYEVSSHHHPLTVLSLTNRTGI